jgi:hypothetical protein
MNRPHEKLCNRSLSPWGDAECRPSHADCRKALQRQIMEHELSTLATIRRLPRKTVQLAKRLMVVAVSCQHLFRKCRNCINPDTNPEIGP